VKTYIYAHGQVLAQHDGNYNGDLYFYLHDRLGSVRQVIDTDANVKNRYVYEPYGSGFTAEVEETVDNPFTFTGQWYDEEIGQYYLRARMYDPQLYRFTARDPYQGDFTEPLSLHVYLYCANDSVNRVDTDGRWAIAIGGSVTWNVGGMACALISQTTKTYGLIAGALARNAVIGGLAVQIAYSSAGTAGLASVFGIGEEGAFYGSMFYYATGIQQGNFVGGVSIDYAWSPNAQKLSDLAGGFIEVGGSGTMFGGSISRGIGSDIYLITGSLSWGAGTHEVHAYVGHTRVEEW